MKHKLFLIVVVISILLINIDAVNAAPPYMSYTYNYWGEPVTAPQAFLPTEIIDGEYLGIGALKEPSDIFVSSNNKVYIVDSGNNRIVRLDENLVLEKVIENFTNNNMIDTFKNPQGIFVAENDHLIIADTDNSRLIELDHDGEFVREISALESDLISEGNVFRPTKLVLDKANRIYVLAQNINQGIIELDNDGMFRGFMGANRVTPNMVDFMWKRFSTAEQRGAMALFIPTEYNNITIDTEGFIYVTTNAIAESLVVNAINSRSRDERSALVRRLNPTGFDVLRRYGFYPPVGEISLSYIDDTDGISQIIDVDVGDYGIYSVLDSKRGRIFTYDLDGNLLSVFGGLGNRKGTFRNPAAIAYLNDRIIVMDKGLNRMTVFNSTEYGSLITEAVMLHHLGMYDESAEKWKGVLKFNSNYDLAYVGIGKSLLRKDQYKEAMENFRYGYSFDNYSKAFKLYRKEVIGNNLGLIMTSIFSVVLLINLYIWKRKRTQRKEVEF